MTKVRIQIGGNCISVLLIEVRGIADSKQKEKNMHITLDVYCVRRLVRKYGPRHFEAALRCEGYGHYKWAAGAVHVKI